MPSRPNCRTELEAAMRQRILVIDGAMGTTIRGYKDKGVLDEASARGERFRDNEKDILNNGDILSITRPDIIEDIHRRFLEAGADIIETNTFSATSIAQSEFFVEDPREKGGRKDPEFFQKIIDDKFLNDLAWEINFNSAQQCRKWADQIAEKTGRKRYVAGAVGPLTVSLSQFPDLSDLSFRYVTFDQVKTAYAHQIRALIAGGVDTLMVETIFDSLNAKAALVAIREVFEADGVELPIQISAAVGPGGETMISGADHGGLSQCDAACEAAVHRPELLARAGQDAPVPRRTRDEGGLLCVGLSERGHAEPARADGLRFAAAGHGELRHRLRQVGLREHHGRLLRQHAGAHRRHRESGGRSGATPCADAGADHAFERLAALQSHEGGELPHDRRAHERRGFAEVREADQGRQIRGSRGHRTSAGRERRERHRHLHGRGPHRRRADDDEVPQPAANRAGSRQGAVHGRFLEVGDHRSGPEDAARQGHREFHLAQGRRGSLQGTCACHQALRRGHGRHGLRRKRPGRDLRREDPHLRTRVSHPRR
jgi:methionine synthase I (cobalamin-dependent)